MRHHQEEHVKNERDVLASVSHPFIANMVCTFKDADSLYIMQEAVLGGELFQLLKSRGKFDLQMSRFYGAQVTLVLEYLHSKDIVYRDLKPENCILDTDGYLKLIDMGLSKRVAPENHYRTYTFCGTPSFIAPEMFKMTGHGKGVDWWALGIFMYEIFAGCMPFQAENVPALCEILKKYEEHYPNIRFDPIFTANANEQAVDLVRRLLHPDQDRRLGIAKRGATDVRNRC